MNENLLPVGSVVRLYNSTTKVMIMGYCPVGQATPGYVWDYSGIPYPYGFMDASKVLQFNKEQIEKIMAIGYQDVETFDFMEKLMPAVRKLKETNGKKENSGNKEEGENV